MRKITVFEGVLIVLALVLVGSAFGGLVSAQNDLTDSRADYIEARCAQITAPLECNGVE